MRPDRPAHEVVADHPDLLDALAVPIGTYRGVAVVRPIPHAPTFEAIVPDLLAGLGKTEVLTRRGRIETSLVEVWLRAYQVDRLFVVGADSFSLDVAGQLCWLGDRLRVQVIFVGAEPARFAHLVPGVTWTTQRLYLAPDPDRVTVRPPVGAALPDVGFPALPAACGELLEPDAAARAQGIYDDCLAAAFRCLPSNRMLTDADAQSAFGAALVHTPTLNEVPLAGHALRAAGLLRGYHLGVGDQPWAEEHREPRSAHRRLTDVADTVLTARVPFDALLTADRLTQLGQLSSPAHAAAGVLAGLVGRYQSSDVTADGAAVLVAGKTLVVPVPARPLLRAWEANGDPARLPDSPPRRLEPRHRRLWARPPPEQVRFHCQPIDCPSFRLVAGPPIDWARSGPERSRG